MEELMDFIHQLHKQDRQREAIRKAKARGKKEGRVKGRVEGRVEGKLEAVQNYISAQANISTLNIPEIAAMFKVDEQLIRSIIQKLPIE